MTSAMKNFAAITGLQPFSLNRTSFTFAFSIAALVIAKLVDAYLFCGFNANFYFDLPIGAGLFVGYCFLPLFGLAVNRAPTTKGGRCCRMFAIVLTGGWLHFTTYAIYFGIIAFWACVFRSTSNAAFLDPFNVCGNRTGANVGTQFSNATAIYDIFQRIDLIFKLVVAAGWLVLVPISFVALCCFVGWTDDLARQTSESTERGKPKEENDEAIIWMEERSEESIEQPSAVAKHGSIEIEDESAPADAAREAEDRMSEVGGVDARMKNLGSEINEPGSNAEPQFKEANEPEFSIDDEEEEATTTKATKEDSK